MTPCGPAVSTSAASADFLRLPGYPAAERTARRAHLSRRRRWSEPMEVTGPIEMHLWASSSALDTDFTAKLDRRLSRPARSTRTAWPSTSRTPSSGRATATATKSRSCSHRGRRMSFVFHLYPTSNVFKAGHRIRLDVSSSNWPRFRRQPEHRRSPRPGAALPGSPPDRLPRRRAPVARGVAGANVTYLHGLSEIRCRYRIMSSSVMSSGGTSQ